MNFIRKKPSSPLDDLTQLYDETANGTIHNLSLEENQDYKRALLGWKSLHTQVLFKLDVLNQTYSSHNYSADELSIKDGIKALDNKAQHHLNRVNRLYETSLKREAQKRANDQRNSGNSNYTVPTLRNGQHQSFTSKQQQLAQTQPRLLKTLRPERLPKTSYNTVNKPSDISKIAATTTFSNNKQNWAPSKSLNSTANTKLGHKSKEEDENDQSGELFPDFDNDAADVFLDNVDDLNIEIIKLDSLSDDEQSFRDIKRNEALSQLEAVGNHTKLSRSKTNEDPLISRPKSPTKPTSLSDATILRPTKKTVLTSPNKSTPNLSTKSSGLFTSLPSSRLNSAATSTNAKISSKPKPASKSKPSSTTNRPTIKSHQIPSASAAPQRKILPHYKKIPTKTSSTASKPIKKPVKPPSTSTSTAKKPATRAPPSNTLKPSANANKQPLRSRSVSPLRDETKDTETINSNDSDEFADEANLSEKEIRAKMEDQIISEVRGIDYNAAKQIFNEIVVTGDEVHWDDIAGLETAKNSLKETVVYPFLRPDLFSGLREPARGMLLFGPPGTGKTMLARAVATESKSTFFSISASSLTSKFLGESEKLVRALFLLARKLSPSIIFVDEIDSLLSSRNENGEHESSRRIKNEFLIQWSELTHAAAGKDHGEDLQRVLVLAATNLPWSIDEAARRRFVRRQYIPLPEEDTRRAQLVKLLAHQKHSLDEKDTNKLVEITDGYSGSDITALAKDAAMGPLRSLGDKLLSTSREEIRPICLEDFEKSLKYIKPSVSKENLTQFEDWASQFGSSGV